MPRPRRRRSCAAARRSLWLAGATPPGKPSCFFQTTRSHVLLLLRDGDLRKSMSSYLADRIEGADNIEVLPDVEICRMLGDQRLDAVEIKNLRMGETRTVRTPAVFTFIGAIPCTDWLPPEIETDSKGFVKTGRLVSASPYWTAGGNRSCSRPAVQASSPRATCGSAPSSGSPLRWGKERWRCSSFTSISE